MSRLLLLWFLPVTLIGLLVGSPWSRGVGLDVVVGSWGSSGVVVGRFCGAVCALESSEVLTDGGEREGFGTQGGVEATAITSVGTRTMEGAAKRAYQTLQGISEPLEKFRFLLGLHGKSEDLFYKTLLDNLLEFLPVVYTPTVGTACKNWGDLWPLTGNGIYLSVNEKGNISNLLSTIKRDVELIVMTDGSRILGLGDLGVHGMGIPFGKLALYVAGAGIDPSKVLPITLDVGTNRAEMLADPGYLGLKQPRVSDDEYFPFVDEVVKSISARWPGVLLQFEDFSAPHCFDLLDKYRNELLSFNDDIQGTGSVVLSGFINAVRSVGRPLKEHRVLFAGAGSAAAGVAELMATVFVDSEFSVGGTTGPAEDSIDAARTHFFFTDSKGLLSKNRGDWERMAPHKKPFCRDLEFQTKSFLEAMDFVKPTAIIGLSGQFGTFNKEVLNKIAELNTKPIIFSLSNPTSNSECTAEDAYTHTNGACIFASGSPFDPVTLADGRHFTPGQGNNMYIFPGLGLGALLCKAKGITDTMVTSAAYALAEQVDQAALDSGLIYPPLAEIRSLSAVIAARVMKQALTDGMISALPVPEEELEAFAAKSMWTPVDNVPMPRL